MKFEEKCRLVRIYGAIDKAIGDTDPDVNGMTDQEIREEEPLMWAAIRLAEMIGPGPWDKYTISGRVENGKDRRE